MRTYHELVVQKLSSGLRNTYLKQKKKLYNFFQLLLLQLPKNEDTKPSLIIIFVEFLFKKGLINRHKIREINNFLHEKVKSRIQKCQKISITSEKRRTVTSSNYTSRSQEVTPKTIPLRQITLSKSFRATRKDDLFARHHLWTLPSC